MEEEVERKGEEDLEEHRVVEESIKSARREEEEVHHAVRTPSSLFASACLAQGQEQRYEGIGLSTDSQ
jgi:hypothetical protein